MNVEKHFSNMCKRGRRWGKFRKDGGVNLEGIRYDTKAKLRPKVKMCEKIGLVIEKANVLRTSEKMAVNLRVCFEGINLLKITIGA